MKCSKCGNIPQKSDQFAWRCNACKKVYGVSLKNIQSFAEKKGSDITETLLKCKECGASLDDGNETIVWKCSCGNLQKGKLEDYVSHTDKVLSENTTINSFSKYIKCSECGKEISVNTKFCPECGCFISCKKLSLYRKKTKVVCGVMAVICIFLAAGFMFYKKSIENKNIEYFNQALDYYQNDKLVEAREVLENIPDYEGVDELNKKIANREIELENEQNIKDYNVALNLFQEGNVLEAKEILSNIPETIKIGNEAIKIENVIEQIDGYVQVASRLIQFRDALKNPDSLEIKEIYYSPVSDTLDKDVLFMTYKATNSFGAYLEETACIQDGTYAGKEYKDIEISDALLAYDQRQKFDATMIQNILNNF